VMWLTVVVISVSPTSPKASIVLALAGFHKGACLSGCGGGHHSC
jgi:hypothetical protein